MLFAQFIKSINRGLCLIYGILNLIKLESSKMVRESYLTNKDHHRFKKFLHRTTDSKYQ